MLVEGQVFQRRHPCELVADGELARLHGFGGVQGFIDEYARAEDVAFAHIFGELGVHRHDDVFHQAWVHRLVQCPHESGGDGFLNGLGGTRGNLKSHHAVVGAGAVAPYAETVFPDEGGYVGIVQGVRFAVLVEQVEGTREFEGGNAVNFGV